MCKATKTGVLRFLSHREWITATERTMRRANFPLWFTQGFHPKPKLTFSRALPTGLISQAIYFVVRLTKGSISTNEFMKAFNAKSPRGLKLRGMWQMQPGKKINKYLDLWSFRIIIKDQLNQEKRKVIAHDVQKKALDTDCVILDKSFFMIEYKTVEKKWLDYRDIMQTLYGERFPRLFYLPLLKEVYRKRESCIPVSDVFDLYGRR
ncbi:MAG: TIGR03936 family radical SAM-associated protein [Thermotogota bacterium]